MGLFKLFLIILPAIVSCHGVFLRLHTFLDDHMVLQREPHHARIWGWATPNINVTVQLDGEVVAFCIANEIGSWGIELPPQPASATGHELTISDGISYITLQDIAFGDVFLCSGQSNMEMSVEAAMNGAAEIADSIRYPNLRLATVKRNAAAQSESDAESAATNYTWARSGPNAFSEGYFSYYSATCYFFGRDLYKQLGGKVPIGLVTSCWGGQRVEAFSSQEALADKSCGGTVLADPTGSTEEEYTNPKPNYAMAGINEHTYDDDHAIPSMSLWHGMIHPLLPMRFAGAIWYQGEANAGNATSYACRFPAMITDWRRKFELDLPFYYVELAGYDDDSGDTWPYVRAAQGAALKLDQVSFGTAIDLGDKKSPFSPIHPRRKQEVGRRLSLSVLKTQYHKNVENKGPALESFQQDMATGRVTLKFIAETATTLHFHGSADCDLCCSVSPFEILDASRNWARVPRWRVERPMSVELEGIPKDTKVLGIRYAWKKFPQCILYSGKGGPDDHEGLPAVPFEKCLYPSENGAWTGRQCRASPDEIISMKAPRRSVPVTISVHLP